MCPCKPRDPDAKRATSRPRVKDSLIDPVFNPGQVILYHLETERVVDQLQRDMIVQVLTGFLQPVLSQLLVAKYVGCVLQGLRILKGNRALLLVQTHRLGFFHQALDSPDGLAGDALNKVSASGLSNAW